MQGGTQQWTVLDGDNPYADFSGTALTYRYLEGQAMDSLLARFDGTTTVWYLGDNLGSVRQVLKVDGTVLDQLVYDSFGNLMSETTAANSDRFKFTGREYDSEIGQYNFRRRNYQATIGRFISEDPIRFMGGDANLYRYVRNSPVDATDPTGLSLAFVEIDDWSLTDFIFRDQNKKVIPIKELDKYVGKNISIEVGAKYSVPKDDKTQYRVLTMLWLDNKTTKKVARGEVNTDNITGGMKRDLKVHFNLLLTKGSYALNAKIIAQDSSKGNLPDVPQYDMIDQFVQRLKAAEVKAAHSVDLNLK